MKKCKIDKKKIERIISDLEKASDTFDSIGMWFIELDILEEDEEKQYDEAGALLRRSITKLKKSWKTP
jgi:hypothetical protein